jgi:hypothetical protein
MTQPTIDNNAVINGPHITVAMGMRTTFAQTGIIIASAVVTTYTIIPNEPALRE